MSRTSTSAATQPKTAQPAAKSAAPAAGMPTSGMQTSIPQEKIAKRAYEKWLKGGCMHGCDQQHWLEAEAELRAEMAKSGKK